MEIHIDQFSLVEQQKFCSSCWRGIVDSGAFLKLTDLIYLDQVGDTIYVLQPSGTEAHGSDCDGDPSPEELQLLKSIYE